MAAWAWLAARPAQAAALPAMGAPSVRWLKPLFPLAFPALLLALALACRRDSRCTWVVLALGCAALHGCCTRERGGLEHVLSTKVSGPPKGETLFFIHGWPDNAGLWDAQVAHFTALGYRCVTLTLPHFGGRAELGGAAGAIALCPWGYTFEELAEICARTLDATLRGTGQGRATLVVHDWGSYLGFYTQRLRPELVRRMVVMDVGAPATKRQGWGMAPVMLLAGLIYQYWLALAFVLANCVRARAAASPPPPTVSQPSLTVPRHNGVRAREMVARSISCRRHDDMMWCCVCASVRRRPRAY
jgi:pimeloyl-ACP methyl ester carboxylesterase